MGSFPIFMSVQLIHVVPAETRTGHWIRLELQTIVKCLLGAGSQTKDIKKISQCP